MFITEKSWKTSISVISAGSKPSGSCMGDALLRPFVPAGFECPAAGTVTTASLFVEGIDFNLVYSRSST